MKSVLQMASKIASIPGLNIVSRAANRVPREQDLVGYLASQQLAKRAVAEVAAQIQEGWSERQAADLLNTCLRDYGVRSFFHQAFVWYGERTRFRGFKTYFDYLASGRVVRPGDVYILDVAPIVDGYICDIGYTSSLGENIEFAKAEQFLARLKDEIPLLFSQARSGADVWNALDDLFHEAGYDNIHAKYPFSVLGHRVHRVRSETVLPSIINFGWQSYWEFLSRGLFGQLLNQDFHGDLTGLWAIEPHIGTAQFGAKFEEILVVENGSARWLEEQPTTSVRSGN